MSIGLKALGFAAVLGAALTWSAAMAADYANPHLLMESEQLAGLLGRADVRLVDVRPQPAFDSGHIPGAVHLGADDVIDPHAQVKGELLPLPGLVAMLEERGIGRDTRVVLYDDQGGFHAARLFWMLEHLGHRHASILNGGFPKWEREKRPVTTGRPQVARSIFSPSLTPRRVASADWLLDRRGDPSVVVIDVRPVTLHRAGHIPWARSIPWALNLKPDQTMKSADELLMHFAAHGVTRDRNIAVHCQDGKAAGHSYFTLRLLGFPRVRSYDRSWAEWGAAEDLPKSLPDRG